MPIDSESKEFIDWAFTNLNDEEYYQKLLAEVRERFESYYTKPREEILATLKPKMEKGALEHGAPSYPIDIVYNELTNEYTDLLGWLLVGKWIEHKEQSKS